MIYILKVISVAVIAAAVLMMVALLGVIPSTAPAAAATVTPTPTATPTATVVAPTATPTATAAASPRIDLYPTSLSFTAKVGGAPSPAETSLYIRNSGSGNMRWTVSATLPWIGLLPTNGASTGVWQKVTVWIDPSGLGVGTHSGYIRINSDDADNSPQLVLVSLTVTASPTATPKAKPSATPSPTPSASPTPSPTPTPAAGGGLPMWVWPVVGVLAVLALAFGIMLLHPARLWGRLKGLFPRGGEEEAAEGLTTEEMYEGAYGDEGGEPPEDYE